MVHAEASEATEYRTTSRAEGPNFISLTYLLLSLGRYKTSLLTVSQHSVSCVCSAVKSQNGEIFSPHL